MGHGIKWALVNWKRAGQALILTVEQSYVVRRREVKWFRVVPVSLMMWNLGRWGFVRERGFIVLRQLAGHLQRSYNPAEEPGRAYPTVFIKRIVELYLCTCYL